MKLACRDLTISYNRHPVVHHVDYEFCIGSATAIIGPNGAGKSTLLKAILGEVKPETGRVILSGFDLAHIAYMPQYNEIDNSLPLTVSEVVLLGAWHHMGLFASIPKKMVERVSFCLNEVGLSGFEKRSVAELSKGQLQRVLFARIIMQDAQLIFLDEPFNNMDMRTIATLLDIINNWKFQGRTVIAVLHDLAQVANSFDKTVLLAKHLIAAGETKNVLTNANINQAYAHNLNWFNVAPDICEE